MLVIIRDYLEFKRTFFLNNLFKLNNPASWYGLFSFTAVEKGS